MFDVNEEQGLARRGKARPGKEQGTARPGMAWIKA
jgi:hypothetical protein